MHGTVCKGLDPTHPHAANCLPAWRVIRWLAWGANVTLDGDSVRFALDFLAHHSDGDIFPPLPELSAINDQPGALITNLTKTPLSNIPHQPSRRLPVPKDDLSYRQATQLHPQDSVLLTALLHQYGHSIEQRRLPSHKVFSYRFNPTAEHGLYGPDRLWNVFWSTAGSHTAPYVLYCDIADFYNQISHHALENELVVCGFPNQAVKWIISLLASTAPGVSRGVPIGPHGAHLLAECTLIPIDSSLRDNGLDFLRYADDLVVFCGSKREAQKALQTISTALDSQQRLMIQERKTRIFSGADFREHCDSMVEDRPISDDEEKVLGIVRKYSDGNPYVTVTYNQIDPEDWESLSEEVIGMIVEDYLSREPIDYVRLRWFFRRLSQVGHYGALKAIVSSTALLGPCLPSACSYISSIQQVPEESWRSLGEGLSDALESGALLDNEFSRMSILSLFSKNHHIDHLSKITPRFNSADSYAKREILLAARNNTALGWIREQKGAFRGMDPWQRMAFICCVSILPRGERQHFLRAFQPLCSFEAQLMKWAKDRQP